MDIPEEFKDFNIGKDPDLEDGIGQTNQYPLIYPGCKLPILAPGRAVRVRKDVSATFYTSTFQLTLVKAVIILFNMIYFGAKYSRKWIIKLSKAK